MWKKITITVMLAIATVFLITAALNDKDNNLPSEIDFNEETREEMEKDEKKEVDKGKSNEKERELPKLAIILDDIGNNFQAERNIEKIEKEITLAVLPFREDTHRSMSFFSDREIILHIPLQPLGEDGLEEEMLMTDMSSSEIKKEFERHLSALGNNVYGVNNHKGSAFTSDENATRALLSSIKKNDLYFVDSFTIGSSVGFDIAREMGIPTAKRDVFLDNSRKKEDIKARLEESVKIAEKKGSAVAIGHGYPETISVLIKEMHSFGERVEFVNASDIVK